MSLLTTSFWCHKKIIAQIHMHSFIHTHSHRKQYTIAVVNTRSWCGAANTPSASWHTMNTILLPIGTGTFASACDSFYCSEWFIYLLLLYFNVCRYVLCSAYVYICIDTFCFSSCISRMFDCIANSTAFPHPEHRYLRIVFSLSLLDFV